MLKPRSRCWGEDSGRVEDTTAGLIELCQDFIKSHMVGVEIGSFRGASGEVFSHFCKHITCVDGWELSQDERGYAELTRDRLMEAEKEFDAMLAGRDNITKMKMVSDQAASSFADASLDFVYIDGAHDPINVELDIRTWAPKLNVGGFLLGHDHDKIVEVIDKLRIKVVKVYSDTSWASWPKAGKE